MNMKLKCLKRGYFHNFNKKKKNNDSFFLKSEHFKIKQISYVVCGIVI